MQECFSELVENVGLRNILVAQKPVVTVFNFNNLLLIVFFNTNCKSEEIIALEKHAAKIALVSF